MSTFISGKVNGKRRRAAMQAALYHAREHRIAKLSSGPPPLALLATFNHIWARGDRLATGVSANGNGFASVVTAGTGSGGEGVPFTTGLDGQETSGGPFWNGNSINADATTITFTFAEAIAIAGFKMDNGDSAYDMGNWDAQISSNGTTWTTVTAAPFHWLNASGSFNTTWTNTTATTHFRFIARSTIASGGRLGAEFVFKIMAHPVLSSFATVSLAPAWSIRNSRTVADFQDGKTHFSTPTSVDQVSIATGATPNDGNGWFAFDFGADNLVNPFRFMFDTDGQAGDWGTWKWQLSVDGVTYTDSAGATFAWNANSPGATDIYDGVYGDGGTGSTERARYWRLMPVTLANFTNMNGMYEITFDLGTAA